MGIVIGNFFLIIIYIYIYIYNYKYIQGSLQGCCVCSTDVPIKPFEEWCHEYVTRSPIRDSYNLYVQANVTNNT